MSQFDETKAVFVRLAGRVQGVWFRAWTKEEADRRGLKGWVRNMPDGAVEAMLVGAEADVDDMLTAIKDGPPLASVDDIRTQPATGVIPNGFEVRRTPGGDDAPDFPPTPSI